MAEATFTLVLDGKVRNGQDSARVVAELAKLFRSDEAKIAPLLTGRPTAIKKHLPKPQAQKYKDLIEQTGAICHLEEEIAELNLGLIPPDNLPSGKTAQEFPMCPKCKHTPTSESDELITKGTCPDCGIVVEKYLQRQRELEHQSEQSRQKPVEEKREAASVSQTTSETRPSARRKRGLAFVVLLVLLGGGLFWYWWSHPLLGHRTEIASAVQALQDLQAATQVGITYAEYSKRLIDTQVLVNRAIQGKPSRKAAQLAYLKIEIAMATYKYAHDVWAAKFEQGEYGWKIPFDSMRSLVVRGEGCPALNRKLEVIPLTVPNSYADKRYSKEWSEDDVNATAYLARFEELVNSVPVIWGCASDKIATIEADL